MIENIVIRNSPWAERDLQILFFEKDEDFDMKEIYFSDAETLQELMVEIGAYKSKGESFRANRNGIIPKGWTEMWANKKQKIYIWNPTI